MANLAIANGARGWFSYAYHNAPMWVNGSVQRTLTGPFLAFSDLWLELDKRMARVKALAPLLLTAEPARLPDKWYVTSKRSTDHTALPDGLPAISSYRLRGNDFNVYFVVNNDTRGMTSVFVNIPPEIMKGLEIYDLSDFVTTWNWAPMRLERHIEMFPGQARVILVAKPEVCAYWRDRIAQHLVQDDLQQLSLNLQLARAHGINIGAIEEKLNTTGHGDLLHDLVTTHAIRAMTLNLIYQSPVICEARSRIIEACSAVCGCDGALCRLINKGKKEIARELGMNVLPIAREFTRLRLDLRNGKGGEIREQCEEITKRAQRLLTEIREQAK